MFEDIDIFAQLLLLDGESKKTPWGVRAFWRVGGCIQDVNVRSRTQIDEHVRDWVGCGM
jgi:hypothetical protein